MVRADTKQAVLREIAKVIRAANAEGKDGMEVAKEKFPGTPFMVLTEASVIVDMEDEAEWWDQVESTIDGEIVRKSLQVTAKPQE